MLTDRSWAWLIAQFGLSVPLENPERFNFITAAVTATGSVATILAVVFAALSIRAAARQMQLSREQLGAQTFIEIIKYEKEIGLSQKMDEIRQMQRDRKRLGTIDATELQHIRDVADFFNHVAHLVRNRYVQPRHFLRLYWYTLQACDEVLILQLGWLAYIRSKPNLDFSNTSGLGRRTRPLSGTLAV